MTEAFDRFKAQYDARGREKADGYAPSHFAGMTDAERSKAADLLYEELATLPALAAEGLVMLDEATALSRLQRFEREHPEGTESVHEIYFRLWELSGDRAYEGKTIGSYDHCPETDKGAFFARLSEMPPSPELLAFVRDRIVHEDDDVAQGFAARIFLTHGSALPDTPAGEAQFDINWKLLKDPNVTTRLRTLQKFDAMSPAGHRD